MNEQDGLFPTAYRFRFDDGRFLVALGLHGTEFHYMRSHEREKGLRILSKSGAYALVALSLGAGIVLDLYPEPYVDDTELMPALHDNS